MQFVYRELRAFVALGLQLRMGMIAVSTLEPASLERVFGGALHPEPLRSREATPSPVTPGDKIDEAWGRRRNWCRGSRTTNCFGTRVATEDIR